jgi:hypothetical protein
VTLSDEDLRTALAARARRATVDRDLGRTARAIAISTEVRSRRPARLNWGRLGRAGVLAVAGVLVIAGVATLVDRFVGVGTATPPAVSVSPMTPTSAPASGSPTPSARPAPSTLLVGCETLGFNDRRCDAAVARARESAGNPTGITTIGIHRPTSGSGSVGSFVLATVDFTLGDGSRRSIDLRCMLMVGPRSSDRVCSADPQVWIAGGVSRDTPCGPAPGGDASCATLPPDPRPATVKASRPLQVPILDVPLDHLGHYEVLVGQATIPDGALSERAATLAEPRPTDFWIDPYIEIEVRPDIPGRFPIDASYANRFDGPEPVHVYLVFDVVELEPGAVLQVRDLVVR